MIRLDISDLTSGREALDGMVSGMVLDVTNKLALDSQTNLRNSTPVNTGNARDGWQVVRADRAFSIAEVINPVSYIVPLIYGHSAQAPQGWFDNAIMAAVTFGGS